MAKEIITERGLLYDLINYKVLIKSQASNRFFLGSPKKNYSISNKKYNNKPKIKKLTLENHKKIIK